MSTKNANAPEPLNTGFFRIAARCEEVISALRLVLSVEESDKIAGPRRELLCGLADIIQDREDHPEKLRWQLDEGNYRAFIVTSEAELHVQFWGVIVDKSHPGKYLAQHSRGLKGQTADEWDSLEAAMADCQQAHEALLKKYGQQEAQATE